MWVFTRYGFFSIACDSKGLMHIRARSRQHLVQLCEAIPELSDIAIDTNKGTDYSARIIVDKVTWSSVMMQLIAEHTWYNFKTEVKKTNDKAYESVLYDVWHVLATKYGTKLGSSETHKLWSACDTSERRQWLLITHTALEAEKLVSCTWYDLSDETQVLLKHTKDRVEPGGGLSTTR